VVKPDFPPEYGFRSTPHWGPFDSNTEVETWTFAKAPRGWACTVVSLRQ
jgi:hypothetical protein